MKRINVTGQGVKRFGITHPHHLNIRVGYRGGVRK